jgi:hypothetical protein
MKELKESPEYGTGFDCDCDCEADGTRKSCSGCMEFTLGFVAAFCMVVVVVDTSALVLAPWGGRQGCEGHWSTRMKSSSLETMPFAAVAVVVSLGCIAGTLRSLLGRELRDGSGLAVAAL